MRRFLAAAFALSLMAACGGGGGGDSKTTPPPPKVPAQLVPLELSGAGVVLSEDASAKKAFRRVAQRALIAEGRLWQLRQTGRLVGTLQVASMKTKVDLREEDQREAIVSSVLAGSRQEIDVDGLPVFANQSDDKTVYVWFAKGIFEVLQLKGAKAAPEQVLTELIAFQRATPLWKRIELESGSDDEVEF